MKMFERMTIISILYTLFNFESPMFALGKWQTSNPPLVSALLFLGIQDGLDYMQEIVKSESLFIDVYHLIQPQL